MWIQEDEYFVRCACGETDFMLSFWFNQEKNDDIRELYEVARIGTPVVIQP